MSTTLRLRKHADKSAGARVPMHRVRAADLVVDETGDVWFAPDAAEKCLLNPDTPAFEHEPWPLSHVSLEGDAPAEHGFPDSFVARAIADGYLTVTNPRIATSQLPDGVDPYFRDPVVTGDAFVFHLADGDLTYAIVEAPGKYPDESDPAGYRITNEYTCRLELEDDGNG